MFLFLHYVRFTEGGFDGLAVGDGGEPLGSVFFDVIVEDSAVHIPVVYIVMVLNNFYKSELLLKLVLFVYLSQYGNLGMNQYWEWIAFFTILEVDLNKRVGGWGIVA